MLSQETFYCPIRKQHVAALPEEHVRQRILLHMINDLEFPSALITIEKGLRYLPHLTASDRRHIPDRRADIICFAKGIKGLPDLFPLLAVECKAVRLTSRVVNQVLGYNHFIRASFIAVVNQAEIKTGWHNSATNNYEFIDYLPSYPALLEAISSI